MGRHSWMITLWRITLWKRKFDPCVNDYFKKYFKLQNSLRMHACIHLFIQATMSLKGLYDQDTVVDAVNMKAMVLNMKWNFTQRSNMQNKQKHSCSGWDRKMVSFGCGYGESNLQDSQGEANCFSSIKTFSYIIITYIYSHFHYLQIVFLHICLTH